MKTAQRYSDTGIKGAFVAALRQLKGDLAKFIGNAGN
jgi:hypothetical protein